MTGWVTRDKGRGGEERRKEEMGLNGPRVGMEAVLDCRQPGAQGVRSRVAWGGALGRRPAGLSSARCQVLRLSF